MTLLLDMLVHPKGWIRGRAQNCCGMGGARLCEGSRGPRGRVQLIWLWF